MRRMLVIAVPALLAAAALGAQSAGEQSGCAACADPDTSWRDYDDPDRLAELILTRPRPYLLVDVRTPEEYRAGHIPGSANIPLRSLLADGVGVRLDTLVIVYCASGTQSAQAARILRDQGYIRIVDFGGITRWKLALETGAPGE
jgi:phage shock protein E